MSNGRKPGSVYLLLLVICFLAVSCGGGAEESASVAGQNTEEAERQVATFIFTQEFDSLNSYYSNEWISTAAQSLWNVWAWHFDEENNPVPVLVTEMPTVENGGISEDGTVLTMTLRDDIVWSDGTPITSDDFLFTYEMIIDPNNTVSTTYPYDLIATFETPEERKLVITFDEPFVPWAAMLWHGILPAHILRPIYEAEGTLDNAAWNNAPSISAGPYVFAEWESGSFTHFVANENYWLEGPKIDEIFIRFVPDTASQVAAMKVGDGDLAEFIPFSEVPALEEAGVRLLPVSSGFMEGWYFYLGDDAHPAVQDVRVRQAIALAVDRFAIAQDLLLGLTKPAATFWDNTPYTDPAIEPWPYDPERANALLDEAGWVDTNGDGTRDKDGIELALTHGTTVREVRQDTQAIAQDQLADVGIKLETLSYEPDIFFAGYGEGGPCATGELDICQWSDAPFTPDPDVYYWLCSEIPTDENPNGGNRQALCDEQLDALFQEQASQMSANERQQTFHTISQIMFEEVYWLGIWQDPDIYALSDRLDNVTISGVTPFFSINEWELEN